LPSALIKGGGLGIGGKTFAQNLGDQGIGQHIVLPLTFRPYQRTRFCRAFLCLKFVAYNV